MVGVALGSMDGVTLGEGVNGAAVGSGVANVGESVGESVGTGPGGVPSKLVMSFCPLKFLWSRMVTPFATSE